jgi:hypothetical protein
MRVSINRGGPFTKERHREVSTAIIFTDNRGPVILPRGELDALIKALQPDLEWANGKITLLKAE